MATHQAAICPSAGRAFNIETHPTPKPGPGELLIAVKAVALNPADHIMRSTGLFLPPHPTVIGFDMAGLVVEVGEGVPTDDAFAGDDDALIFRPGTSRVAAYAAFFWRSGKPEYGAFQEFVLVPWQHAVPLPDTGMSWSEAATLPVAVQVPLSAWDAMDLPHLGTAVAKVDGASGETQEKEALLVWGASSSVGTMGVQSGRLLKADATSSISTVYATAGAANLEYVRSLGADRVFDYKDPRVVDAIVSAAKEDGLVIRHCFLAIGALEPCQAVLKVFLGHREVGQKSAKIASAPPVPQDAASVDGMDVIFLQPSSEETERLEQFRYWMGTWLRENLVKGVIKPSPKPKVVGKGLEVINVGLDMLSKGVSCTKLVVEIGE